MTRARAAAWTLIALVLFAAAALFSFAALSLVPHLHALTYRKPEVTPQDWRAYRDDRDPQLGWPRRGWPDALSNSRGAPKSPAKAALAGAAPCVSLFGDSFTFGDEVADEEA